MSFRELLLNINTISLVFFKTMEELIINTKCVQKKHKVKYYNKPIKIDKKERVKNFKRYNTKIINKRLQKKFTKFKYE